MRSEIRDAAWQFWLEKTTAGGSLTRCETLQKQFQHLCILQNFPNSLFHGVHLLTRRFFKYITKHNFICIAWRDFLLKKKKITNQSSLQEVRKKETKMRHIKNYINLTILTITLTVMVKTIEWQILLE